MAKRSSSSRRWLDEHFSDPFVKKAQQEGYRSRAVYKLLELHERYHLFKSGMVVVDLGAAPGGWSQLVTKLMEPRGKVFALDILPIDPIAGVEFIQGDFSSEAVLADLLQLLKDTSIDWVICDIAPNMSGNDSVDIPRAMYLAELAFDFACHILPTSKGGLVLKLFQGEGFEPLLLAIKKAFKVVILRKPKASRNRSKEIYVLAREFRG